MTECDVCKILHNKDAFHIIHEDDICLAILHEMPATPGHTLVFPKEHYPIFEEVPEDIVNHIFILANKLSSTIFESLGCKGTNIIVNNGIAAGQELPHFIVNIIPREESDNVNFEWTPYTKEDTELSITQSILKQALIPKKEGAPSQEAEQQDLEESAEVQADEMVKRLHRIP